MDELPQHCETGQNRWELQGEHGRTEQGHLNARSLKRNHGPVAEDKKQVP